MIRWKIQTIIGINNFLAKASQDTAEKPAPLNCLQSSSSGGRHIDNDHVTLSRPLL